MRLAFDWLPRAVLLWQVSDGNTSPAYFFISGELALDDQLRSKIHRTACSPILFHSAGSTLRPAMSLGHVSEETLTRSPVTAEAASGLVKKEFGHGSWQYSGVRGSHGPRDHPHSANTAKTNAREMKACFPVFAADVAAIFQL